MLDSPFTAEYEGRIIQQQHVRLGLIKNYNRVWGFHIYRCTYKDDSKWEQLMKLWDEEIREHLSDSNDLDLLSSMDMRYHDDKPTLDGASSDQVREDFRKWLASDDCKRESEGLKATNWGARYEFCVYVDEGVLESILGDVPEGQRRRHYFKIIDSWWGVPIAEEDRAEDPEEYQEYTGQDDEDWPGVAKFSFGSLIGDYESLNDHHNWYNMAKGHFDIYGDWDNFVTT